MAMRGVTAAALAVMLMGSAVPAVAQQGAAKPATEGVKTETGKDTESKIGPRTVTGTVKATTDKGFVVVGRETGQKDREWAFALDGATRVNAVGKARTAKDLREGDPVTVTYTNRDGKIVAQSVTVNAK